LACAGAIDEQIASVLNSHPEVVPGEEIILTSFQPAASVLCSNEAHKV
jgi:hypothetical protein